MALKETKSNNKPPAGVEGISNGLPLTDVSNSHRKDSPRPPETPELGLITNSYPETMNPYRIIPLITESYP